MFMKSFNYLKVLGGLILFIHCYISVAGAFEVGEKLEYDIKKFGITVGTATFEFKGDATIEGQTTTLIQVIAKGFQFYDEENIYLNKETYFPFIVKRELNIFGKKESIIEKYDQAKGSVEISGRAENAKAGEVTRIQQKGVIDNIYGFIYRYRLKGSFKKGEPLIMQLPTRKVILNFVGEKNLKIAGKKVPTYYMEDTDKKIKVWFDQTQTKVPYKINGAIGLGKTSLLLKMDEKLNLKENTEE